MQRVFVCEKSSTCPLFDYTWDWLVDARPADISSLVFLFFQFEKSVESELDTKKDTKTPRPGNGKKPNRSSIRESLRVVFEPPIPRRNPRRLKERIMRYANNINHLSSRTSRHKVRATETTRNQSVAMVTAANDQIRVAVFCDAKFNVELSRQITEQILTHFVSAYAKKLKDLRPDFAEEAKDQNEARTHIKYMDHFKEFSDTLKNLLDKHPKSNAFTEQTVTSYSTNTRSRAGSRFDEEMDSKAGKVTFDDKSDTSNPFVPVRLTSREAKRPAGTATEPNTSNSSGPKPEEKPKPDMVAQPTSPITPPKVSVPVDPVTPGTFIGSVVTVQDSPTGRSFQTPLKSNNRTSISNYPQTPVITGSAYKHGGPYQGSNSSLSRFGSSPAKAGSPKMLKVVYHQAAQGILEEPSSS